MKEMKDSRIQWIGQIPEDWSIRRVKTLAQMLYKGNGITKDEVAQDGNIQCIRYGEIYSKYDRAVTNTVSLTKLETIPQPRHIQKGDILFAGTGEIIEEIGKNVVYLGDKPCLAGGDIVVMRPIYNPVFLNYALNSIYAQAQKSRNKTKLKVVHITASEIGNIILAIPALEVQEKIASYLDDKCSKIDDLILRQGEIIKKLTEYKVSIITEVVTQGLGTTELIDNLDTKWIGSFPKHWKTYRVANLYEQTSEPGLEQLPILTVSINSGISDRELSDDEKDRVFVRSEDRTKYKRVRPGDLAYNMMRAWQGAFGAVRVNGMVSPAYVTCRPKPDVEIDSRYIEYLFRTPIAIEEMHRYSHGIADFRLRLYWSEFKNIRLCLPPLQEQIEIADYIDKKTAEIDENIERRKCMISKLQEYKKSLIYEVVTGKKEV